MSVHEFKIDTVIRGLNVVATGTWVRGDASVGIFGIEVEYSLFDAGSTMELYWELTDEEYSRLCDAVELSHYHDCQVGDWIDPPDEQEHF